MKRLIIPLMKKYRRLLISVILVSAMGCGIMTGLSCAYLSLKTSLEGYVRDGRYPDAVITAEVFSRERIEDLLAVPGISGADARLTGDTTLRGEAGRPLSVRAFSYGEGDRQGFRLWEQAEAEGGVLLEVIFASDNGIHAGDTVRASVDGETREYKVAGLVSLPETLAVTPLRGAWGENSDFGYVYFPESLLAEESDRRYREGRDELDEMQSALDESEAELSEKTGELTDLGNALLDGQSELQSSQAEYDSAAEELRSADAELAERRAELDRTAGELQNLREELQSAQAQLSEAEEELNGARGELEARLQELEAGEAALSQAQEELSSAWAEFQSAREKLDAAGIVDPAARAQLEATRAALTLRQEEADSRAGELAAARAEWESANAGLEATVSELEARSGELESRRAQLESAQDEWNARQDQWSRSRSEFDTASEEADTAREELESAARELDEKKAEYDDYASSLADARTELESAGSELERAKDELESTDRLEELCNQLLLYFDDGADPEAALAAAEAALGDVEVLDSFTYADSAVKQRIDVNLEPVETMSVFMPAVFFLVILIVVFLFMSLIIRQSRREIGILRALGFTRQRIQALFCAVDLLTCLPAVALGCAIGWAVTRYVGRAYADYFPLPQFTFVMNLPALALSAVLTVAVGQAATLLSTGIISGIRPSEAMSHAAPTGGEAPPVLRRLTRRASPMVKFSVTSLLRNPMRFLFSVICVAASVVMIFSSLAFLTSKDYILRELFESRIRYDCQIYFRDAPDEEVLDAMRSLGCRDVQRFPLYDAEIVFGSVSRRATICAPEPGSDLIGIPDGRGGALDVPETGILLERHLARELGVGPGDTVTADGIPLTVAALSEQSMDRFQYVSPRTAALLRGDALDTVLCRVDREREADVLSWLAERDDYLYSSFTHNVYAGNLRTFRTYDLAAWLIILSAVIIGLVIVTNTARTNLLEKKKELSILRVLGFQHGEISRSWFSQSALHFFASLAVGFPTGMAVAKTALRRLTTEGREYVFANSWREYFVTAALVFLYMLAGHFLSMRSMRAWDLVENVKEKE